MRRDYLVDGADAILVQQKGAILKVIVNIKNINANSNFNFNYGKYHVGLGLLTFLFLTLINKK